jgi:hypothetical protein
MPASACNEVRYNTSFLMQLTTQAKLEKVPAISLEPHFAAFSIHCQCQARFIRTSTCPCLIRRTPACTCITVTYMTSFLECLTKATTLENLPGMPLLPHIPVTLSSLRQCLSVNAWASMLAIILPMILSCQLLAHILLLLSLYFRLLHTLPA